MHGSGYRIAFERLKAALAQAEQRADIDDLERARGEMDAFVASLVTDPRRLRALAGSSRAAAAEVEARAAELDIPRLVLDPVHDAAFARLWVAWLDERGLRILERALADEVNRRRQATTAAVYVPRRRPAAASLARLFG